MTATISVKRLPSTWQDRLRDYKLVVDGSTVASIRQGHSAEVAVEPGHHRVWMRISWCRSRIVDVDVGDGERVRLICRAGASPLLGLLYVTVWRARYIDLQLA